MRHNGETGQSLRFSRLSTCLLLASLCSVRDESHSVGKQQELVLFTGSLGNRGRAYRNPGSAASNHYCKIKFPTSSAICLCVTLELSFSVINPPYKTWNSGMWSPLCVEKSARQERYMMLTFLSIAFAMKFTQSSRKGWECNSASINQD